MRKSSKPELRFEIGMGGIPSEEGRASGGDGGFQKPQIRDPPATENGKGKAQRHHSPSIQILQVKMLERPLLCLAMQLL